MGSRQRGPASSQSGEFASVGDDKPGLAARLLSRGIARSVRIQRPALDAYLGRLRSADPGAAPADIVATLRKHYLATITASGAAVGAAAAVPAIGTLAALSAVAGETGVFLEATAFFVLAVAQVHGIPVEDRERRRALVLAVLVGDDGKQAVADLLGSGRTSGAWLSQSAAALPLPAVSDLNRRLMRYFLKRYTLRRGVLTFGKLLPVGLGAVIGAVGNRMMGRKIVRNAHMAFGTPPDRWPVPLRLLPTPVDTAEDAAVGWAGGRRPS